MQFIASGKTERVVHSQIGDVRYHYRTYSDNRWTTKETFKEYLIGIREYYNFPKETIHVICDGVKVHI